MCIFSLTIPPLNAPWKKHLDSGIKPESPALQEDSSPSEPPGKPT